jgi:hypothetical protein
VENENFMTASMHSFFAKFLTLGTGPKSVIPLLRLGAKCELKQTTPAYQAGYDTEQNQIYLNTQRTDLSQGGQIMASTYHEA